MPTEGHMTKRVREILSYYRSENPGVLTNLARLLNHGRLGGTGKFVILPVDQDSSTAPPAASPSTRPLTIRIIISSSRSMRDAMRMRRRSASSKPAPRSSPARFRLS